MEEVGIHNQTERFYRFCHTNTLYYPIEREIREIYIHMHDRVDPSDDTLCLWEAREWLYIALALGMILSDHEQQVSRL